MAVAGQHAPYPPALCPTAGARRGRCCWSPGPGPNPPWDFVPGEQSFQTPILKDSSLVAAQSLSTTGSCCPNA